MKRCFFSISLFFLSAPVLAQELPLENYFFSFDTCYGRSYSRQHLRDHPDQSVLEIAISHFPARQELLGMESPWQPYPDTPRVVMTMDVMMRVKDKAEPVAFQVQGICDPNKAKLTCAIECDGGGFTLSAGKSDTLMVTLDRDIEAVTCDAGDYTLFKTPEDTTFRLNPLPLSHCKAP